MVDSEWEKHFMKCEICGHCMHFAWKQRKVIRSLIHIDFCCADCVKSFEKVNDKCELARAKYCNKE